jgi:hypothetical protein
MKQNDELINQVKNLEKELEIERKNAEMHMAKIKDQDAIIQKHDDRKYEIEMNLEKLMDQFT